MPSRRSAQMCVYRYTVYQPLILLLLSKGTEWLLSPVRRLFYLNDYGHEVLPPVSEDVLSEIKRSSVVRCRCLTPNLFVVLVVHARAYLCVWVHVSVYVPVCMRA